MLKSDVKRLQWMHVSDGVLYYEDGEEVALWGVNYYAPFNHNYVNLRELGMNHKEVIDEDIRHFVRMGVDVVRLHVYDRTISDKNGNLVSNERVELMDYIVAKCGEAGIYVFITPIAWWLDVEQQLILDKSYAYWCIGAQRNFGFSNFYSKEAFFWDEDAIAAQENYFAQFAGHVNKYTDIAYGNDPAICLFELINESVFRPYQLVKKYGLPPTPDKMEQYQLASEEENEKLLKKYHQWLSERGLEDKEESYSIFREELVKKYINRMIGVMRTAGCRQPIGVNVGTASCPAGSKIDDIVEGVASSEAEVVTFARYVGGPGCSLGQDSSQVNLLPKLGNWRYDARLRGKAKVIYEFEAITNIRPYIYPAMARAMRYSGAQIATMFTYDPAPIAAYNTGWVLQLLNFAYTPQKAIDFMIGREAFHRLKRGSEYSTPEDDQRFDRFAVSFSSAFSLMNTGDVYMYSNTIPADKEKELQKPQPEVRKIVGYGTSPLVEYDGEGIYFVEIEKDTVSLEVFPDVVVLGNLWHGKVEDREFANRYMDIRKTAPVLEQRAQTHWVTLKIPGWWEGKVYRLEGEQRIEVSHKELSFQVKPGRYTIERVGVTH